MHTATSRAAARSLRRLLSLPLVAAAALLAACGDDAPVAPDPRDETVAVLRQATDRYHDLSAAVADGFVFLHGCENRPGEGPVGMVYVHPERLMDGKIDPASPDALIYEPGATGSATLVGVEFAIPYTRWTQPGRPQFLGATFQAEDEFGVFGLHAWVWRDNPRGLFAESNPRVSCTGG
jgi:hypothetical protein